MGVDIKMFMVNEGIGLGRKMQKVKNKTCLPRPTPDQSQDAASLCSCAGAVQGFFVVKVEYLHSSYPTKRHSIERSPR